MVLLFHQLGSKFVATHLIVNFPLGLVSAGLIEDTKT